MVSVWLWRHAGEFDLVGVLHSLRSYIVGIHGLFSPGEASRNSSMDLAVPS